MRFYVGVHSITNDPPGMAIRAATEAFCKPPWVMGAAYPASHAFVAWLHPDGCGYRLDAGPGGAKLSRWEGPQGVQVAKSMFWEILPINGMSPSVAWGRAVGLGPNKILPVPDAIGIALHDWFQDKQGVQQELIRQTPVGSAP